MKGGIKSYSFSLLGFDCYVSDDQRLHTAVVNVFFQSSLSWIFQEGGLTVNHKVDDLILKSSTDIPWSQLAELSFSVIKFRLNFAFNKGESFLSLVNPLSLSIADSHANVDQIAVPLFLSSGEFDQFHS